MKVDSRTHRLASVPLWGLPPVFTGSLCSKYKHQSHMPGEAIAWNVQETLRDDMMLVKFFSLIDVIRTHDLGVMNRWP